MISKAALLSVCGFFFLSCVDGQTSLRGAGATFPYPLYQKWISAFLQRMPGASIDYRPIGSGAGIDLFRNGQVDFAASDAPLSDTEIAGFSKKIVHIPTVIGGVVPAYHLQGIVGDLRFTPQALAGIYLGTIKRWDDPEIKSTNRSLSLPSRNIMVIHRSDASGTTYVWTDYLSKVSELWKTSLGSGTSVKWPVGNGADGNEGVAEAVINTPDSIGYIEFIYALRSHLSYAAVRNVAGRFVQADLTSLPAAAASARFAGDFRISITNAPSPKAYPIASFTYFLVPDKPSALLSQFLRWTLTSGQKQSAALGYAPLPDDVAKHALISLEGVEKEF